MDQNFMAVISKWIKFQSGSKYDASVKLLLVPKLFKVDQK